MAVHHKRKKKQSVPVVMFGVLALALAALGAAIFLLVRLSRKEPAAVPGTMTPQVAEQTAVSSATEVTATATVFTATADSSTAVSSESTAPGAVSSEALTTASAAASSAAPASAAATAPAGTVTGITLTFYSTVLHVGDKPVMPIVTMSPANASNKQEIWQSSNKAVATVDSLGSITPVAPGECTVTVTSASNPAVSAEVKVTVKGADTQPQTTEGSTVPAGRSDIQVINGITYVQGVMIANKSYPLPADYNPGLDANALAAFNEMAAAASKEGLKLTICSGFRSYDVQKTLYNNYCNRDGKAAADRFSARPGHSEHQTGLAMDINYAGDSFNNTPEAKWLADNCWKYGFIIRYPEGKESITGYKYESWHVRYLGKDWSKTIYESGLTLEEYFGIDSKYAG